MLHNKLNRFDLAVELLEQVEQSLSGLGGRDANADVMARLAKARSELGQQLVMLGRTPEAVDRLRSAIETYGRLTTIAPNHPPHLEGLASARISLANARRLLGHDAGVVQSYEQSVNDYGDLLKTRPGVPQYRESLALARTDLAQFLSVIGRNHEAKEHAAEALREFVDLFNTYPTMYRYYAEQAVCTQTFGIILRDLDDRLRTSYRQRLYDGQWRGVADELQLARSRRRARV